MSMAEFWAKSEKIWPKTAAPSSADFSQVFRKHIEAGHQVVCITVTSKLSSTYNSAVLASQQFPPGQIAVIDSQSLSVAQGFMVLAAARAAEAGQDLNGVVRAAKACQRKMHIYILLENVQYLVKGGRASKLSGILANLLKIRPTLGVRDGELVLLHKLRGRSAAKQRLLELIAEHFPAKVIAVAHIDCADEARKLAEALAARTGIPLDKISIAEVGMTLATHGGPKTMAVAAISL
jgi:DegV family protein with EDD domain